MKEAKTNRPVAIPLNGFEDIHSPAPNVLFEESYPLPKTLPEVHHHISNTTRMRENIFRWVDFHEQNVDGAIKGQVFIISSFSFNNFSCLKTGFYSKS